MSTKLSVAERPGQTQLRCDARSGGLNIAEDRQLPTSRPLWGFEGQYPGPSALPSGLVFLASGIKVFPR